MNAPLNSTNLANPFDRWFEVRKTKEKPDGESIMGRLYDRLDGAYPHKWRSNFPNQQAIDNWAVSWAEAFEEEGITPSDIKDGLKACRTKYDWPPSCAEFVKACKPSVDPLVAYYEAVAGVAERAKGEHGKWSHPAVYWAAMPLSFDLGAQTYSQIKPRWERALAEQMDRGEWPAIPAPMVALPAPGKTELSRDAATKMLNELGAQGVIKPAQSKSNHRIWATRIIEKSKQRDHGLSALQIRFAKEAIGAKEA